MLLNVIHKHASVFSIEHCFSLENKANAAGGADKDSGSDLESKVTDDNIYSSIGETYSTMNLQPQIMSKQNKAFAAMY